MKLRRFQIDGFKALDSLDVAVPGPSLFLIGVNGAGKSSVLQALSFVRHFVLGRSAEFFEERGWNIYDVRPRTGLRTVKTGDRTLRLVQNRNLQVSLLLTHEEMEVVWDFSFNYSAVQLQSEAIWMRAHHEKVPRLVVDFNRPNRSSNETQGSIKIEDLKLSGSLLSYIPIDRLAQGEDARFLGEVQAWALGITSLELLSPVAMRRGVRGKPKDIGPRGERLAGFIAGLTGAKREELVSRVSQFYPLANLDAVRKTAGWIDMKMLEKYSDIARVSPAHMSDGFMRILALCAIPNFDESVSLVLLDEVEDGIEPHILPPLIEFISSKSTCQFVMTSHSPLLINFFSAENICFLTRRSDGRTAVAKPNEMDMFVKGSEYFGVGEIWVNSSSATVSAAIAATSETRTPKPTLRRQDPDRITAFMEGK